MNREDLRRRIGVDGRLLSVETWDQIKHTERFIGGAAVVFVLTFSWTISSAPVISDFVQGYHRLALSMMAWMLLGLSFNFLLGQTGLLSFGHAMFWGGSGYAAALFALHVSGSPLLILVVGVLFSVVLAFLSALVLLRLHGVYFAIVTLAIAQTLYRLVREPLEPITKGINGLRPSFDPLLGVFALGEYRGPLEFLGSGMYVFLGIFFVATIVLITRVRKSPYGLIFKAVQENETRARFVGLDVWRYKYAAFMLSAFIGGLAGTLFFMVTGPGLMSGSVVPERMLWTNSGNLVVMVVLGGLGTLAGPLVGVFLFQWMGSVLNGLGWVIPGLSILGPIGQYWQMLVALAFTAVVWTYPEGVWGMITDATAALREPQTIPEKLKRKTPGLRSDAEQGDDR
ncbi:branched-chain amino acid ABC transporter permease [Halobellus rubicundus]|uniref:Branched-chain amino acid ABC transporter permease n=1 Tax=Halobellus rubicundus TaxID=2996466 RepID=A0ABD5MCX7_9EURY